MSLSVVSSKGQLVMLGVPEGTGKQLIVRVPKGTTPPYGTSQCLFKKRVGKNCMLRRVIFNADIEADTMTKDLPLWEL